MITSLLLFEIAAVTVFGALIGSFLNVVVYRVPAGRSIVSPPSSCGSCGTEIRPYDNVPVLSWIVLGGRCRSCRSAISPRYPLVEAGTTIAFAVVAWWFWAGPRASHPESGPAMAAAVIDVVAYLYLLGISIALALIDTDTSRLPDAIVLPSFAVAGALLISSSLLRGDLWVVAGAGAGGAVMFGVYLALALAYPGGMGFGDVKLAGLLGVFLGFLGWPTLIVGGFSAFLFGGVYAMWLLLTRRARRGTGIPFGPWMIAGAWVGILAGPAVSTAYLSLLGVS